MNISAKKHISQCSIIILLQFFKMPIPLILVYISSKTDITCILVARLKQWIGKCKDNVVASNINVQNSSIQLV